MYRIYHFPQKILTIFLCVLTFTLTTAKSSDFVNGDFKTQDLLQNATIKESYYEPSSSGAYLGLSAGMVAVASVLAVGVLLALPESISKWDRSEIAKGSLFRKYKHNFANSPIVDKDEIYINWVAHPYVGALYYLQPRMAGFSWAEGAIFSFLASSFYWEYGLECFAEVPSWQDLVITPAIGSLLGEGFYQLIRYIQRNDNQLFGSYALGIIITWLLDPLGSIIYHLGLGEVFGIYNKNEKVEFVSTPIVPNGKGGVQISFAMRF